MKERFDWNGWTRRLSTWLALVSTSTGAAAAAFIALPGAWQAGFPAWAGQALAIASVASAALVPVATSFLQSPKAPPP